LCDGVGTFLAEEFSVALATGSGGFEVIDRTNLKTLLQEHKLAATGIIDPQTARKVGEIAGVQALVAGTVTPPLAAVGPVPNH
jgi:curli biogenesis system outer membrane secretion channel CsgG